MKLFIFLLALMTVNQSAFADSKLCSALETISKNAASLEAMQDNPNTWLTPLVQETKASYQVVDLRILSALKTNTISNFINAVEDCGMNYNPAFKMIDLSQLQGMTADDKDKLSALFHSKRTLSTNMKVHDGAVIMGGLGAAGIVIGLATGGELVVIPTVGACLVLGFGAVDGVLGATMVPSSARRLLLKMDRAEESVLSDEAWRDASAQIEALIKEGNASNR